LQILLVQQLLTTASVLVTRLARLTDFLLINVLLLTKHIIKKADDRENALLPNIATTHMFLYLTTCAELPQK